MTELSQKIIKQRFEDFALRMAKNCFYKINCKGKKQLISEVEDYVGYLKDKEIFGWDEDIITTWQDGTKHGGYCLSSDFEESFEHYLSNQEDKVFTDFGGKVCCCIRAAIDLANPEKWQGGVVGFTVGDLRKMYPKGIPDWIKSEYKNWKEDAPDDFSLWL